MKLLAATVMTLSLSLAAWTAQDGQSDETLESIWTVSGLYDHCAATGQTLLMCHTYIRGFPDGNMWLLRYSTVGPIYPIDHGVCVPNAEPIALAADLFVARFRGRQGREEMDKLSPHRALSIALSSRYPCPGP